MPKLALLLFVLLVGRAISQCPLNCQLCLKQPICTLCSEGFALTMQGGCTLRSIPNCRVYASSSSCQICESTFVAAEGQCNKDTSGCLSRTPQGTCQFCGFGTRLLQGVCSGVLNCDTYDSMGACLSCRTGYSVSQGKCFYNKPECVFQTAGLCSKCKTGYLLNGFSCLLEGLLPPHCELYSQEGGHCMICASGYQLQHRYCQRIDMLSSIQSAPSVSNALQMPQDVLDSQVVTSSRQMGRDNLLPLDYGVRISSFMGSGNEGSGGCWLKGADGSCKVCVEGYNLHDKQCVKLPPACLEYSLDGKNCVKCIASLSLKGGRCVDINCAVGVFSKCAVCKPPFQPDSVGICLNPNCTNLVAGQCQQCQPGTTLNTNHLCLTSDQPASTTTATTSTTSSAQTNSVQASSPGAVQGIKHCKSEVGSICVNCQDGYFPNSSGGCKRVIIGCLQLDPQEESCVLCMSLYTLDSGNCLFPGESPTTPSVPLPSTSPAQVTGVDPHCQVKNKGSCAFCQERYVLNVYNFSCMAVDQECLDYNRTNGMCLSCRTGYLLFEGWCLESAKQKDPACQISNINNFCINCSKAYYSLRGKCSPENSLCKSTEYRGGNCLSCYNGYILYNGLCIEFTKQPACLAYDFQNICSQCAPRYYLQSGACLPVSPLCMDYDPSVGNCLSCIPGYGVSSSTQKCMQTKPVPANCDKADPTGKCLQCSARYFINVEGNCQAADLLCDSFEGIGGKCLQCFPGYKMMGDKSCVESTLAQGCTSGTKEGQCSACLAQYVLNSKGGCLSRDPNCLEYKQGMCLNCTYQYYISVGVCKKKSPKSKDPNCLINDLYNYCQQCTQGYFISEGNCRLVDQLCRTYDPSNGNCLTCYEGYRLSSSKCYLNTPIFHCHAFNGNICTQCQAGYSVTPDGSCS